MIATHIGDLLRRLRKGAFDPADIGTLERTSASDLRLELVTSYRWVFQEYRLKSKWEFGAARSIGLEMIPSRIRTLVPSYRVFPVLRYCVFCSGDGDRIGGVSVISKLVLRPKRQPMQGLIVYSGAGFSLDRYPDGWAIKTRSRSTVHLNEALLQKRGWQFDMIPRLVPSS